MMGDLGPLTEPRYEVFNTAGAETRPAVLVLDGPDHAESFARLAPWAVVIGVGDGAGRRGEDRPQRMRDYTPPAPRAHLPARPNGAPWPAVGGAPDFLDWLRGALIPRLARAHGVDPTRLALFGHSLGGLFALYALAERPELFRAYLVSSPSIWFARRIILAHMSGLDRRLRGMERRRVSLSVGACEQNPGDDDARRAWMRGNRMVGNARAMAARLAALPELAVSLNEWPGADHRASAGHAISMGAAVAHQALRHIT